MFPKQTKFNLNLNVRSQTFQTIYFGEICKFVSPEDMKYVSNNPEKNCTHCLILACSDLDQY